MAATENSQLCLEKRNIQRTSDGAPLRSVHWGMNVLFAKKAQHNSSGADKRFSQKASERASESNSHPKSALRGSKSHQKSVSSTEENQGGCGLGRFLADGVACGQTQDDGPRGNNALGRLICSRFDPLEECEGRRVARGGGAPGGSRANETRITSLRKLLNAPLAVARAPAPGHRAEGGVAKDSSDGSETQREESSLQSSQLAPSRSRSTDAQPETAAAAAAANMNGEINKGAKTHRKRAAKNTESVLNAACHDEVKEKIAELARMPRIKSLDEILESLHIKVDPKAGAGSENANATCSSEKCSSKEECYSSGKHRTAFHDELSDENHTSQASACGLDGKGNISGQETSKQTANRKEERAVESKKHVKVLISGEVSRKPKPTYPSKVGSGNSRECHDISVWGSNAKSGSQSVLATRTTEFEDEYFKRNYDWKTKRKLQSVLVRKRQVHNTKELKAILQARTSYRKEIPSGRNCASETNTFDVPCKKQRRGPNVTFGMLVAEECQWNGGTICEAVSPDIDYPNSDFPNDINVGSSNSNEEISLNNTNDCCNVGYSPAVSELDQYDAEDNIDEVQDILRKLPPLNVTDINWTESQDCEPKVKAPEDIQCLVDRMQSEHLEGVNGNYNLPCNNNNCESLSNLFRGWHETVVRPSNAGNPLALLPYVVID